MVAPPWKLIGLPRIVVVTTILGIPISFPAGATVGSGIVAWLGMPAGQQMYCCPSGKLMGLPAARQGGRVVGALDLALPEFPRWNGMEWKEGRKGRRSDDGLTGWLAGWCAGGGLTGVCGGGASSGAVHCAG